MIIFYFSGTGNTKFIAKTFSRFMNCESHSIEENIDFRELIIDNNIITLCYPIHFSKSPIIFMEFVDKYKDDLKGKKIISLCSQQFFSGDGARSIVDFLEDVEVIYAEHFNMQNNITSLHWYYKLTKVNSNRNLKRNYKKLYKASEDIKNGKVRLRGFNNFSKTFGKFQNIKPERLKEKQANAVKINENCIMCNKCVVECPTKNLENNSEKIVSKNRCTFCFRCVNICPKQAITVIVHGEVKEQYYIRDKF